jgi:signal peptidase II
MQTEGGAPLSGATTQPAADSGSGSGPDPGRPATRWGLIGLLVAVAVFVVTVDQLTKAWVVATMPGRDPIRVVGSLLQVTYTRNSGAAFSIGTGTTWIFTAIALVVVVVILRTSRRLGSWAWAVAMGALLGGALGNLSDRLFRAPGFAVGHVVDFLELPHWPVFNVADSCIVSSALLIGLLGLRGIAIDGSRDGA